MDIIIRNGTIVDGSGKRGFEGDLGITGEKIAAVGKVDGDADLLVDATGMVVAPGFVDMHAHTDFAFLNDPSSNEKLMQGVTTNVIGNCGLSPAPANEHVRQYFDTILKYIFGETTTRGFDTLGEFLGELERSGTSTNVATYAAHGIIKCHVTEMSPDPPTGEELAQMKGLLREAMKDGAFGLSSGLVYPPGAFSNTDELIELFRIVAEFGGIYATHIRDEANRLEEAVAEAIEIGRAAGVPIHISHHKSFGKANWGKSKKSLQMVEDALNEGLDVTLDQHPYKASSTLLAPVMGSDRFYPENVMIASTRHDHSLEGRMLKDIAKERGKTPRDAAEEILSDEDGAVTAIFFEMDDDDIVRIMKHPTAMIGTDGIETDGGRPHPRLYGTFPCILGRFVRERAVLTLEEAVRKMTSMGFERLDIKDRGLLREGCCADVAIFDPETIADRATYEDPRQFPIGIEHVIVNGTLAVNNGKQTSALAGKVIRKTQS
jgi:N-acyl-D-amino-acid deacylase